MEILRFKAVSLLVIFGAGLLGGLAPIKIGLTPQGKRKLTFGNAFSGGVFLGAGLLHMLPDATENFTAFAGDVAYPCRSHLWRRISPGDVSGKSCSWW